MSKHVQETIKQEIVTKMRAKGMNPRGFAQILGVQPATLYRWFNGQTQPHTATVLLACYVLGISVDWHRQTLPEDLADQMLPPSDSGTVKDGVVWF